MTNTVISDFIGTLKETSELVRDVTSREGNHLQLKIVLGRQLSLITEAVNKFMQSSEHNSTTMVETIINSIQYVTDILNHLPVDEELNDTRMEVISLSNFLRMNLASFSTSFDMSNKIASASLLSQVLIGDIPNIDKLPDLPPIANPQKFFETYFLMYNAIQSNIGVYEVLMYTLDVIPYDTMKNWSVNVVKNLSLMHNLIHKLKLRELFETKKIRKPVNLFKNIYYISNTLVSLVYTLHEIYLRFDGIIPNEVVSFSPIGKITPLKLIDLVDSYKLLIDNFMDDLKFVYKAKLLNLNDNPEKIAEYRLVAHAKELLENIKLELLIILEGIYESKLQTYENYIKSSYSIIDFFIEEGGGVENIMENYHVNYIIELTKYTSPYIAQYCLIKGNPTPYYDFIKIDFIEKANEVHEVKRSKKIAQAHKYQLLYYLYFLKKRAGINAKGVLNYPLLKKTVRLSLDEENKKEIREIIRGVGHIKSLTKPPEAEWKSYCKNCAYSEFCWQ